MSPPQVKNFKVETFIIPGSDISFIKTHNVSPTQAKNLTVETFYQVYDI